MDYLSPLTVCLCMQLSVCLLGSTASAGGSLWGKKVRFSGRPCMWQLQPGAVVPALQELSACLLLRRNIATEWTGFVYKAPGGQRIELGLGGTSSQLTVWLFGERQPLEWELKVNEWYSVCLTWSASARRLRTYINGTSVSEAPVNRILPHQLAGNGTLTLGASHYVNNEGDVLAETGNNLLGEIGLFRIWSREWSAAELRRQSCADGDVVSWDLRQWKYSCPPVPDKSIHCAWSHYKIKMTTVIVHSTEPGNCVVPPEGVTRRWLESIFPQSISVHDIAVSSPSQSCPVVNNSAALHVRQPQGSRALSDACDKCFSCEVHVNVDPAANVEVIQADITALLSLPFSHNFLNLTADPESISIHPVESFHLMTKPSTTVSTGVTPSETGQTQSMPARPANTSTTGNPLDHIVGPDKFFRVNTTLQMSVSPTNPKDMITKWVKETLEVNDTMLVLNLIIKENSMVQHNRLTTSSDQQKQYYCTFHVQEYNMNCVAEIITSIRTALTSKYENGSVVIEALDVAIKQILPKNCLEETTSTVYGPYIWPEAFPQVNQEMGCQKPKSEKAYRLCKLNIETDMTTWAEPDMTNCKQLVTISGLDNVTVTAGNAAEVVDIIQELVNVQLGNTSELSSSELGSVVEKLKEVVDVSDVKAAVGADIVTIIADILLSKTDVTPVANTVLNLTDRMGNRMDFQGESASLTAPCLALSMINVDADGFRGLTFGVSSVSPLLAPKIFLNQSFVSDPLPDKDVTISLPSAIHDFFTRNSTRVQFQFYGTDDLFQDPNTNSATQGGWTLNSYIVSASINNCHVSNLKERVVVTLNHQKLKQPEDEVKCMFWDFGKNRGQGGWNSEGCETWSISSHQTSCLCDHLTHFAVLLGVSRAPISEADSQILTVISFLGCGVSSIFLGITLLTYLAFEKLRRDYPSKILINLSAALLGLNMFFLLDSWLSSFSIYGLCIATAATLHYFLLASFTWMGLEAVHMYLALIKVFNIYVPSYILKFCIVGWGLPLVIVSLVLAIDKDAYGNAAAKEAASTLQSADQFCWLQDDVFFYVTVVAFVLLILLCNISVFVVVLIQIRQMRANKPSANSGSSLYDLRTVASLTVLLGLTWSLGFFSFGPGRVVLMYLFTIFNTVQGFFVFLFHCLMKENVRKQWRIHLCCGRFRLSDNSGWSRSVTVGGRCKKNHLINSEYVTSDNTSSTIRKVSDSSASSAPNNHHQGA
ncbi:adhesion G-protein coupled receptor G4 isoform X1 [Scophthalmus maximus]|uniref:adhesion G-protein coupled receptor G4 isoform X1 n=1 Tax=Scophthalmus maximus TaxID=52904 RepID=UPI001FA940B7|nr:adhesion G-protein coupled receptor G4 isoform X1 [Scophthalmus maximus]XP_035506329.2 adhesion G-protein coupled receptor G4 isoform X1 [Scophthalmus maximus]